MTRRLIVQTGTGAHVVPPDAAVPRSVEELVRLGEAGLRSHLAKRAVLAHRKYGRLTASSLPEFLRDPECVRRPTRIVFGFGPMAPHQFAEPAPDPDDPFGEGIAVYLRPALERRPDLWPIAVAYLVPVINYGAIAHDGHCLTYGATLLGMLEDEFYGAICALADFAGVAPAPR